MQLFREKTSDSPTQVRHDSLQLGSPQLWLSVATLPCLSLLILGRTLTYGLTQFGMASEEVFRGIQLPIIDPANHRHS